MTILLMFCLIRWWKRWQMGVLTIASNASDWHPWWKMLSIVAERSFLSLFYICFINTRRTGCVLFCKGRMAGWVPRKRLSTCNPKWPKKRNCATTKNKAHGVTDTNMQDKIIMLKTRTNWRLALNSRMVSMPIYFFSNAIIGDFMNVGVGQNSDTGSRDARVRFECQLFSNSQRQKCHGLPVWRTQTKVWHSHSRKKIHRQGKFLWVKIWEHDVGKW